MAIAIRYFSTSGAGDADGTSWANRAALFNGSGYWSTALTGFDFSGSDALEARIGPGSYTMAQTLASASFANPPTVGNTLTLHGCDSSGDKLEPPDPGWVSAQPVWGQTGIPVISYSGNFSISAAQIYVRLLSFNISGIVQGLFSSNVVCAEWVYCYANATGTAFCPFGQLLGKNCAVKMDGYYAKGYDAASNGSFYNCRMEGNTASGGGVKDGFLLRAGVVLINCVAVNNYGSGFYSSAGATSLLRLHKLLAHGNSGSGLVFGTALTTGGAEISGIFTGNGAYGINLNGSTRTEVAHARLRDNTSGNFSTPGNIATNLYVDETVTSGATAAERNSNEFVDPINGDYRIKPTSHLWGKWYGFDYPLVRPFNRRLRG